jgi:hypothetical protein
MLSIQNTLLINYNVNIEQHYAIESNQYKQRNEETENDSIRGRASA